MKLLTSIIIFVPVLIFCFFCAVGGKETGGTQGGGEEARRSREETRGEEGRNSGKTSRGEKTRSDSSTATATARDCAQSVHALRGLRSEGSSLPQRIPRWVPLFFTQHPLLIRGIISEPTRVCLSLGVEEVLTDCKSHKVVIKGEKADPLKVLERIQRKSHRKVELLSPIPKPPEEKVPEEEKPKPKLEEKVQEVCFILHSLLLAICFTL